MDRDTALPGTIKERGRKHHVCGGFSDREGGALLLFLLLLLFVFVCLLS